MIDRVSRDGFERIRLKQSGLVWPDADLSGGGVPAIVGRVTSSGSNIAVGKFLMVQPTHVLGNEVEGGGGTFDAFGSSTVPVYLIGPAKPSTGDYLVCRFVDNRWVAERTKGGGGGGGFGTIPNCFCTAIPANLTMTSADPSCNYRMFQSCSISYGPHPGFESLNFGAKYYLSDLGFPDPVANGAVFYYTLLCQYNQFSLTRAYLTSPYGSPFRDGILYTWLVGGSGNSCSPFHLDNGTAFPGSDPTCRVMIDGA